MKYHFHNTTEAKSFYLQSSSLNFWEWTVLININTTQPHLFFLSLICFFLSLFSSFQIFNLTYHTMDHADDGNNNDNNNNNDENKGTRKKVDRPLSGNQIKALERKRLKEEEALRKKQEREELKLQRQQEREAKRLEQDQNKKKGKERVLHQGQDSNTDTTTNNNNNKRKKRPSEGGDSIRSNSSTSSNCSSISDRFGEGGLENLSQESIATRGDLQTRPTRKEKRTTDRPTRRNGNNSLRPSLRLKRSNKALTTADEKEEDGVKAEYIDIPNEIWEIIFGFVTGYNDAGPALMEERRLIKENGNKITLATLLGCAKLIPLVLTCTHFRDLICFGSHFMAKCTKEMFNSLPLMASEEEQQQQKERDELKGEDEEKKDSMEICSTSSATEGVAATTTTSSSSSFLEKDNVNAVPEWPCISITHTEIMDLLAKNNDCQTLDMLLSSTKWTCDSWTMAIAAARGHRDMVAMLHERYNVPFSVWVHTRAAWRGRNEVLLYLSKKHCPKDCKFSKKKIHLTKWARQKPGKVRFMESTDHILLEAIKSENERAITWALKLETSRHNVACCYMHLIENDRFDVLKMLYNKQPLMSDRFKVQAAQNGRLEILQWLVELDNGWPHYIQTESSAKAALGGHLNVILWMQHNNHQLDYSVPFLAARHGHFDMLQYVACHMPGFVWSPDLCSEALMGGHTHIYEWLVKQGCLADPVACEQASQNFISTMGTTFTHQYHILAKKPDL